MRLDDIEGNTRERYYWETFAPLSRKVTWISIGGISWDVVKMLGETYGEL
jgi:hypothetical protein